MENNQLSVFDYTSLDADTAKLAKESAIEIKAREKAIWENIIEIGNRLIEVKNALPHGKFLEWIKYEFKWSRETARKYMVCSKELKENYKDSCNLIEGFEPFYALASGLSKADEETKEEILTAVEEKTEEKGKALTEKEIKKITEPYAKKIKELEEKQAKQAEEVGQLKINLDTIKTQRESLEKTLTDKEIKIIKENKLKLFSNKK